MVNEFLKSIRSGCMEQKMELETEYNRILIKQKENEKQMLRLKEEEMQNFDAFSPRKQKSNLKDTISNLEKENQMFHQKIEEMKEQKKKLDAEILKISSVGNSSLKGAVLCAGSEEGKRKVEWIKRTAKEMNLA